ncbi:MAG: hypothetical protein ABIQ52_01530 [Vicinamibacterales bacterium]
MHSLSPRTIALSVGLAAIVSIPLAAHDAHTVGPYRLSIGWAEEPAFTGIRNAIAVEITEAATGAPVEDLGGGSLSAEVAFGSERVVLPLQPAWGRRNTLRAWIVPTRAGTYTFHITGTVKSQPVDITTSCSEKTFDCVVSAAEIQFPSKDPSAAQLAERVERSLPRADRAVESAERAQLAAFAAMLMSAVALLGSVWLASRRTRAA